MKKEIHNEADHTHNAKTTHTSTTVQSQIEATLTQTFAPEDLQVINQSHHHAGHAGSPGTGESHFLVVIKAKNLTDLSRLKAHKAVMDCLKPYLDGPVHAVSVKINR